MRDIRSVTLERLKIERNKVKLYFLFENLNIMGFEEELLTRLLNMDSNNT